MSRMPAEWEPHEATWLCWPHNSETWPGRLEQAEAEFGHFVAVLSSCEDVHVLVQDEAHREHVIARVPPSVQLHVVTSDDSWLRDTGPTFCLEPDGELLAIDWVFDSWGGKYPPWERDDAIAEQIAKLAVTRHLRETLTLEGGALEVDGRGTLLATRGSVLERNQKIDNVEIERRLSTHLGLRRILWIDAKIAGDDTDAHVDNIARFVAPGRVVCASESNSSDANYRGLARCADTLRRATDANDVPLEIIDLPMPGAIFAGGNRLPASYANFYLANGAVLVPVFGCNADASALGILADLFADRDVIGVPSRSLVRGLGSLHCLSQQQPAKTNP